MQSGVSTTGGVSHGRSSIAADDGVTEADKAASSDPVIVRRAAAHAVLAFLASPSANGDASTARTADTNAASPSNLSNLGCPQSTAAHIRSTAALLGARDGVAWHTACAEGRWGLRSLPDVFAELVQSFAVEIRCASAAAAAEPSFAVAAAVESALLAEGAATVVDAWCRAATAAADADNATVYESTGTDVAVSRALVKTHVEAVADVVLLDSDGALRHTALGAVSQLEGLAQWAQAQAAAHSNDGDATSLAPAAAVDVADEALELLLVTPHLLAPQQANAWSSVISLIQRSLGTSEDEARQPHRALHGSALPTITAVVAAAELSPRRRGRTAALSMRAIEALVDAAICRAAAVDANALSRLAQHAAGDSSALRSSGAVAVELPQPFADSSSSNNKRSMHRRGKSSTAPEAPAALTHALARLRRGISAHSLWAWGDIAPAAAAAGSAEPSPTPHVAPPSPLATATPAATPSSRMGAQREGFGVDRESATEAAVRGRHGTAPFVQRVDSSRSLKAGDAAAMGDAVEAAPSAAGLAIKGEVLALTGAAAREALLVRFNRREESPLASTRAAAVEVALAVALVAAGVSRSSLHRALALFHFLGNADDAVPEQASDTGTTSSTVTDTEVRAAVSALRRAVQVLIGSKVIAAALPEAERHGRQDSCDGSLSTTTPATVPLDINAILSRLRTSLSKVAPHAVDADDSSSATLHNAVTANAQYPARVAAAVAAVAAAPRAPASIARLQRLTSAFTPPLQLPSSVMVPVPNSDAEHPHHEQLSLSDDDIAAWPHALDQWIADRMSAVQVLPRDTEASSVTLQQARTILLETSRVKETLRRLQLAAK